MEENKKTEDKIAQTPQTLIEQANAAAERMERANKVHLELVEKEEKAAAMKVLGGKTENVSTQPVEETPKQYAERVMKGEIRKK